MEIKLSRDAQKVQAKLYKEYLEKRKGGIGKSVAREISDDEIEKIFKDDNSDDVSDAINELKRNSLVNTDILGNVMLNDELIINMENRFKDNLTDVLSFLSQFIP